MDKNFWPWHDRKAEIDKIHKRPFFHEREIWFCHLGLNVGSEQDGTGGDFLRPVVISRKFNNDIFWGIPLTRTRKPQSPYYFNFSFNDGESSAILSQIRLIDARRLSHHMGEMEKGDFQEMKKRLGTLLS